MTRKPAVCLAIEPALVAAATGDADRATSARVESHTRLCAPCREDFARYRAIDGAVYAWRRFTRRLRRRLRRRRRRFGTIAARLRRVNPALWCRASPGVVP